MVVLEVYMTKGVVVWRGEQCVGIGVIGGVLEW